MASGRIEYGQSYYIMERYFSIAVARGDLFGQAKAPSGHWWSYALARGH